ncbi:MAG: ABC transporter permease [Treponema sp.]|uniref:ABC transporter permease n=1 Tax=Treponema sp. TaxID=166 RepID=UPI002A91C94D|nr:ABC transporter permease [Treponema sp.]MDY6397536.1 ABC transporter permease [Treponema sp.]
MEKTLILHSAVEKSLALSNLSRKAYRTVLTATLIALSSAVLFASLVLSQSLKSGIAGLRSRMGADLLVVPEGYEKGAENILLSGEPNYFYMERKVLDSVRAVEGVENASGQFYLTSLSESCCDFPIQIIGFEPESDFVIQNWAKSRVKTGTNEDFLLSGSNVNLTKGSVKFFGNEHKISARLSKSGTGMDNVIFCDFASLERIFEDASSRGFGFISDGDTKNKLSTVLVKISPDSSADAVALRIKKVLPGVHVIVGEKFIRNFSEKLSAIFVFLYSISILLFLITIISLALVFSITINERRREFSILRVLGANRSLLCSVLFWEAGILGAGGSILGIGLSALIVIPFNALIAEKLGLPFAMSGPGWILAFAGAVFVVTVLSCLISAANGAVRVSKIEPYGDVK